MYFFEIICLDISILLLFILRDELISKEEEVIDTLQGIEEFEERLKKQ